MEVVKYNTPFFEPGDFVKTLIQKRDDSFEMTKEEATLLKPVEFIKTFLERKGEQVKEHSLEELIKQAISVNSKKSVLIAIDEAQLLNKEMIELIRILADSKAFWFLLAMHKHESKKILSEPQFRSRPHRVLELEPLSADEIRDFIVQELLKIGEYSLQEYFDNKLIKEIYKLTKGNFRDLKKLLHRMFLIMEQAKSLKRNGYDRVNSCLVTMAAIDGEILDI
jgi:type II secretory pathway predicted ATPase ExeA